jgi:hypothetical protein
MVTATHDRITHSQLGTTSQPVDNSPLQVIKKARRPTPRWLKQGLVKGLFKTAAG